jgi:hypothetical protein
MPITNFVAPIPPSIDDILSVKIPTFFSNSETRSLSSMSSGFAAVLAIAFTPPKSRGLSG